MLATATFTQFVVVVVVVSFWEHDLGTTHVSVETASMVGWLVRVAQRGTNQPTYPSLGLVLIGAVSDKPDFQSEKEGTPFFVVDRLSLWLSGEESCLEILVDFSTSCY